jgi:hypothetical protein
LRTLTTISPAMPSTGPKSSSWVTTGTPWASAVAAIQRSLTFNGARLGEMDAEQCPRCGDGGIDREELDVGDRVQRREITPKARIGLRDTEPLDLLASRQPTTPVVCDSHERRGWPYGVTVPVARSARPA